MCTAGSAGLLVSAVFGHVREAVLDGKGRVEAGEVASGRPGATPAGRIGGKLLVADEVELDVPAGGATTGALGIGDDIDDVDDATAIGDGGADTAGGGLATSGDDGNDSLARADTLRDGAVVGSRGRRREVLSRGRECGERCDRGDCGGQAKENRSLHDASLQWPEPGPLHAG